MFEEVVFPQARYSLFATPAWVDQVLADLRERARRQAKVDILWEQERRLQRELTKIIQRVNLFEKVMIPFAKDAIRRIRIQLGDEMTAAVGRGKLAKKKLSETYSTQPGETETLTAIAEPPEPIGPEEPDAEPPDAPSAEEDRP